MLVVEDKFNCKAFEKDTMSVVYHDNDSMTISITERMSDVEVVRTDFVMSLEDFRRMKATAEETYGK